MVLGKRSTIPFDGGLIVLIREWSISPRARELNFVMLWIAAIFCAAIGQHTQELYLLFVAALPRERTGFGFAIATFEGVSTKVRSRMRPAPFMLPTWKWSFAPQVSRAFARELG
jgi:hypothetical protein